jgi:hypothetical protein
MTHERTLQEFPVCPTPFLNPCARAIREQALGAHHPKTTETRTRLIALLHAMEQHDQAAQLEDENVQSES